MRPHDDLCRRSMVCDTLLLHFFPDWRLGRGEEGSGEQPADDATGNGCDPEQPELRERPRRMDEGSLKDCRTGGAGRVHGGIRNRNQYEMDERETKADGDGSEALGSALVG